MATQSSEEDLNQTALHSAIKLVFNASNSKLEEKLSEIVSLFGGIRLLLTNTLSEDYMFMDPERAQTLHRILSPITPCLEYGDESISSFINKTTDIICDLAEANGRSGGSEQTTLRHQDFESNIASIIFAFVSETKRKQRRLYYIRTGNRDEELQQLIEQMSSLDPVTKRNTIGNRLFHRITAIEPEFSALTPKITGMLMEMEIANVLPLLLDEEALKQKINEAITVLRAHAPQGDLAYFYVK